jgi:origin recognition complex subunit 2
MVPAGLRKLEDQQLLSELAACARVHLVASVDHIHAALLWSKQMARSFNWLWHNVTNFATYSAETAGIPSLLTGNLHATSQHSAVVVLRTLVPNARAVRL